ncbi:curli assembly protein CsgF [Vibrio sp. 10N.222.51.C12]|uniref:curli assembly protein CsgF n=1 Tax=unclassified Vibrio TaxID=2614977 RepID=UPI000C85D746|nr:curli assembly protein CsgF [Vibrio sp. 10N.286.48.B7]PMH81188.1 curli production assembly protein CsgF [Vibrio sp. 10N.286.48.B7]
MTNLTKKITLASLLLFSTTLISSELVYTPVNPSFGGSPLNSSHLFGHANAINDYDDPNATGFDFEEESAVDRLAASLESRLISQFLADISDGTTSSGTLETTDYILNVAQDSGGNGLIVRIEDKITGETSTIQLGTSLAIQ